MAQRFELPELIGHAHTELSPEHPVRALQSYHRTGSLLEFTPFFNVLGETRHAAHAEYRAARSPQRQ